MDFKLILMPLSFVYCAAVTLRSFFYRSGIFRRYRLGAKVISVGNITWGGTGKTPAVLFILKELLKKGRKVCVLTRGYGGDEERLFLSEAPDVPVIVNKNRVSSGKEAINKYSVDTLLLDDGFQHLRLRRDLDIVCVDAMNPFGNGCLIPAGSLREPVSSIKRAGVILLTKADMVDSPETLRDLEEKLGAINPNAVIARSIHKPLDFYRISDARRIDIKELKNKNAALLSAIGSPGSFQKIASRSGLNIVKHFIFRDHSWYKIKDLEAVNSYCRNNKIEMVVTTEKDAVRLRAIDAKLLSPDYIALAIKLEITDNEQGFYNRLFGIYNS